MSEKAQALMILKVEYLLILANATANATAENKCQICKFTAGMSSLMIFTPQCTTLHQKVIFKLLKARHIKKRFNTAQHLSKANAWN